MHRSKRPWIPVLPRRPDEAKSWGVMALVGLVLVVLCLGVGAFSGLLGANLAEERPMVLVGLPLVMALAFAFLIDRPKLLMALLLTRSGMDAVLETTKVNLGSVSTGVGGLLNALIIALTISVVLENKNPLYKKGLVFFGPFLLFSFLSIFNTPVTGDAIKLFVSLLTYFCAFLIGIHLVTYCRGHLGAMKFVAASSFLPVLITLAMVAAGITFRGTTDMDNMPGAEGGRYAGPFTHPNTLAFYLMFNIGLTLYLRQVNQGGAFMAKLWPSLYMVIMVALLLLTKTRSAWVACFAIFLLYALFIERRFLVYLVLGLLLSTLLPSVRDRLADLNEGNTYVQYARLNSYAWRQLLWSDGLSYMAPAKYLFGYGLESFKYYSSTFFSLSNGFTFLAHNVFVEVFFEMGLLGLLSFAWVILGPVLSMWRAARSKSLLGGLGMALILSYALISYSDNVLISLVFNVYFWLGIGVIFAGLPTIKKQIAHA